MEMIYVILEDGYEGVNLWNKAFRRREDAEAYIASDGSYTRRNENGSFIQILSIPIA